MTNFYHFIRLSVKNDSVNVKSNQGDDVLNDVLNDVLKAKCK